MPAGVGEDSKGQKDTKSAIDRAIRSSRAGDDEWGPGKAISKTRPESILGNALTEFSRFLAANVFCPTGPDGGIDPSCKPGLTGQAPKKAILEANKIAKEKIKNAPVPSKEDVAKARQDMQSSARAGGESRGGSAASRRKQRENLFKEFGGAERGYVACPWTGLKLHWTDDPKLNPNGYPKFERGKIFTKKQGGGYQLHNLIPESFAANRGRNDKTVRKENLQ